MINFWFFSILHVKIILLHKSALRIRSRVGFRLSILFLTFSYFWASFCFWKVKLYRGIYYQSENICRRHKKSLFNQSFELTFTLKCSSRWTMKLSLNIKFMEFYIIFPFWLWIACVRRIHIRIIRRWRIIVHFIVSIFIQNDTWIAILNFRFQGFCFFYDTSIFKP